VRDLYRVLGIDSDASQEELQTAYRHRAKVLHPDAGGSAEAFSELAQAYEILSHPKRRERYDRTGEVIAPHNLDVKATEVIAQKLGQFIHADQDMTSMDITSLIEEAIQEDILQCSVQISNQNRAIERVAKLRSRLLGRSNDEDNRLARVLDWHERSANYFIKKNESVIHTMERALEILQDYPVVNDQPASVPDNLSIALHEVLECLKQADQFQPRQY
jgi:curved DNA-binding protein CbpA